MATNANVDLKWEYTIVHTDRLNTQAGPQLAPMWKRKYADGTTDWDQIQKLGEEGWEMVNAFPVEGSGTLQYLAFVFKRPKRQAVPPTLSALAAPATSDEQLSGTGEAPAATAEPAANPTTAGEAS